MKLFARSIAAVSILLAVAALVLAAGVEGAWKGKVTFDRTAMPKAPNPQAQKQMEDGLAMVKKMAISLTLRPNKTYTAVATNVPGRTGPEKSEGTWKQQGNTLWLTSVKENGKPAKDKTPQKFMILDGGKKLSLSAAGMPAWVKVTFTR
jgi:hypothetical protein